MRQDARGASNHRQAEWKCPTCRYSNYATRKVCKYGCCPAQGGAGETQREKALAVQVAALHKKLSAKQAGESQGEQPAATEGAAVVKPDPLEYYVKLSDEDWTVCSASIYYSTRIKVDSARKKKSAPGQPAGDKTAPTPHRLLNQATSAKKAAERTLKAAEAKLAAARAESSKAQVALQSSEASHAQATEALEQAGLAEAKCHLSMAGKAARPDLANISLDDFLAPLVEQARAVAGEDDPEATALLLTVRNGLAAVHERCELRRKEREDEQRQASEGRCSAEPSEDEPAAEEDLLMAESAADVFAALVPDPLADDAEAKQAAIDQFQAAFGSDAAKQMESACKVGRKGQQQRKGLVAATKPPGVKKNP